MSAAWVRKPRTRNEWLLVAGFVVLVGGVVQGAVFTQLSDQRVLVVTMTADADQADREELKRDCGRLPGISVVADRGNPDPAVQGRFPVRFDIAGTTTAQEVALTDCVNRHRDVVRGFLVEGDEM